MKHIKSIVFTMLSIYLFACSQKEEDTAKDQRIKVETATVQEEEITFPIHAVGKVYAKEEVKLSFKTGGFIKNILVNEGQNVKKGQVLAVLNLSEIEARRSQARLGFEKAQRDFDRANNLYRDSVVTLEQLQNVGTQLKLAKNDMDIAEFNYTHSRITAPSDGRVLKQLSEENELIGSGYPVFLFASMAEDWVVRTNLAESDIFRIGLNNKAELWLDAYPGRSIHGYVSEIGSSADPYTGTYEAEITITENKLKMASGLFARFDILPDAKNKFDVIPLDALVEANEHEGFVYVVNDSDSVSRTKVDIREIRNEAIYVMSDLRQGDKVVTTGSAYINNRSTIEVVDKPETLTYKDGSITRK